MFGRPVRSRKKKQMKSRRRKLLRTETDETARIARLMKQKVRRDEGVKIRGMSASSFKAMKGVIDFYRKIVRTTTRRTL